MYTFEMNWPTPFRPTSSSNVNWKVSAQRFGTVTEAASAMTDWAVTAFENGVLVEVRLCRVRSGECP